MRLINVETLQLCEIPKPDSDHPFAILSHTWGNDEVTFQEFSAKTGTEKAGYSKIVRFCAEAELHKFKYAWIDTCCIDKTSSSELSEAINSMYVWYKEANVCYAYLSDVDSEEGIPDKRSLRRSRWFTRGWTLQELIAPQYVIFYDRDWNEMGTKLSLRQEISDITGVPIELLSGLPEAPLGSFCIAQRMSWAANRQTTRDEDIAYCLMGIFDVNMPILYGEGKKAFIRLQEEILKRSDDQSLFAWIRLGESDSEPTEPASSELEASELVSSELAAFQKHFLMLSEFSWSLMYPHLSSALASSPAYFQYGRFIKSIKASGGQASPYSVTNKGLHISLPLIRTNDRVILQQFSDDIEKFEDSTSFLAVLGCKIVDEDTPLAIILVRLSSGRYIRIATDSLSRASRKVRQSGMEPLPLPDPCELYIDTSDSFAHLSRDHLVMSTTEDKPDSLELNIINCDLVECGNASFSSFPNKWYFFALRIKSRRTGRGDAMVLLAHKEDTVGISCSVYQPTGATSFDQILLEWCSKCKDQLQQNFLGPMATDRATLVLANGDKITASINIGADPRFSVVIKSGDQRPSQSRIGRASPSRAYGEIQRNHQAKWLDWNVYSREIHLLPQDKQHYIDETWEGSLLA